MRSNTVWRIGGDRGECRWPGIAARRRPATAWAAGLAAVLCLLVLGLGRAQAQERKVGVVTGLAGEATIVHASLSKPAPLKFQDDVFFRDRIDTQRESVVRVLLGGRAVVTVRELSTVSITEEPRRSIVDFQAGRMALQVIKNLFALGETVEVHTPNAVAAVRGSLLVVEMSGPASAPEAHFHALEAHVPIVVTPRSDPSRAIHLTPNQSVSISGLGRATRISPVRRLSPAQAQQHARSAELPAHARQTPGDHRGARQNHQGRAQDHAGPGQNHWAPGQDGRGQGQPQRGAGQNHRGQWDQGQEQGPGFERGSGERARGSDNEPAAHLRDEERNPEWRRGPSESQRSRDEERGFQPQHPPSGPQGREGFRPGGGRRGR